MSDTSESVLRSIPDIWFDWYARLVPGIFGTTVFIFLSGQEISDFPISFLIVLLIISYIVGSLVAPPSTLISKYLDHFVANDNKYATQKRKAKNENDRLPLRNVSKAHSEAVGMMSCGILLSVSTAYYWNSNLINRCYCIVGIVYFLIFFIERTFGNYALDYAT